MWLVFSCAVLAGAVLLYAPGYLAARAFSIGRFASASIAPLFTSVVLVVAGIAFDLAGVTCAAAVPAAAAFMACAVAWGVAALVRRPVASGARCELVGVGNVKEAVRLAALFAGVAFVVAAAVFLPAVGDPDAFSRHDDSTMHLALIRSFLDTGTYSTLNTDPYLDQGVAGGFYPAAWHVLVAVVASLFGNDVVMANNAVTFLFLVVVFPFALCLMFIVVFPDKPRVRKAGALLPLAFSGFPWGFLVFGQLLPNMMSFMFVPSVMALVVAATNASRPRDAVKLAVAALVGSAGVALAQPNGVFTCGIWAVLYGMSRIFFAPGSASAAFSVKRVACAVALFAVACAAWAVIYHLPFFEGVVEHTWKAVLKPHEGLAAGLMFIFTWREGMHPFLTVVALLGVARAFKERRYAWLAVAYLAALALYIVDISTDGVLKHVLTGFWYTDYYRTGAMCALFAMPVCALGLAWLLELMERLWARLRGDGRSGRDSGAEGALAAGRGREAGAQADSARRMALVPAVVLVGVMAVCQFAPYEIRYNEEISAKSGLPMIRDTLSGYYSWDRGLTKEECAFVERVIGEVPSGSLIVNVPRDGSCWLYGVEGANVFFRRSANTARDDATTSKLLRTRLCDVSADEEVRDAVERLDASYVLRLDAGPEDEATTVSLRYKEENWRGIESIDEDTPGFELLLSEGDMRLYRIAR